MALLSAGLINGAVVLSFHRPRASKGTGTRSASAALSPLLHCHACSCLLCEKFSWLVKEKVAPPQNKIHSLETLLVIFQKGANLSTALFFRSNFLMVLNSWSLSVHWVS